MINIRIEFNNQVLIIPVNPEEIKYSRSASNEKVQIIGLGNIVIKKGIGIGSLSIESFFPSPNNQFYTGVSPKTCVNFLNTIWNSDKVGKIVTEGLPVNLNMYFVIDNFDYDHKAGEEEDIYYTLQISQYIPYGARIINMQGETIYGVLSSTNRVNSKQLISQIYIVKPGDTVLSITKKLTGSTSKWQELYRENTAAIGNNPDVIYTGQKLILPESWVN